MIHELPLNFLLWHYQLNKQLVAKGEAKAHSQRYFHDILNKIDNNNFVADIFHCVAGLILIGEGISSKEMEAVNQFVLECWTGRGFTPVARSSPLSNLMRTKELPEDLYSTYYCLALLIMTTDDEFLNEYLEPITQHLPSYFQPSGWVYNSDWAETKLERRFDIELCLQALMGVRLAILLGIRPVDFPFHDERVQRLLDYISNPRYLTAIYYVILCLILMDELQNTDSDVYGVIKEFIQSHFVAEEQGFREYDLETVKQFQYRGTTGEGGPIIGRHRFGMDHIEASINATTYALWLVMSVFKKGLFGFLQSKKELIAQFLENQKPSKNGGYGTPVMIAKYTVPFGPISTPCETVNLLIANSLVQDLT